MPRQDHKADTSVPDEAILWRLINPHFQKADGHGGIRFTTQAFQNRPESQATSFFLADIVLESERVVEDLVADKPGFGVVAISVGDVRSLGLQVIRDPTDDEPAHVLVPGKKSGAIKTRLKEAAQWVVRPASNR